MIQITTKFNVSSKELTRTVGYLDRHNIAFDIVPARRASSGKIGGRVYLFIDIPIDQSKELFRRIYSDGMHEHYADRMKSDGVYRHRHTPNKKKHAERKRHAHTVRPFKVRDDYKRVR